MAGGLCQWYGECLACVRPWKTEAGIRIDRRLGVMVE
jgi:hypothetical protein